MKKSYLLGVLVLLMAGLSSCEKTTIVESPNWKIVDCNVGRSQWSYTGDESGSLQFANNYFYAGFDLSQLNKTIFNDGNVQVYLVEKNSRGEEMQRPLPFSRHIEEWGEEGNQLTYTETYDYFYGIGWIEINYTASDFAYEESWGIQFRPDSKQFRVVMTW